MQADRNFLQEGQPQVMDIFSEAIGRVVRITMLLYAGLP